MSAVVESGVESVSTDRSVDGEVFTPYAAAKLVNEWLVDDEVDKTLPPQMFYNYTKGQTKKGKKPFINYDIETGKINYDDLKAWYTKYLAKQI